MVGLNYSSYGLIYNQIMGAKEVTIDNEHGDNPQQFLFEHIHNDYVEGYEDKYSEYYKQTVIFPLVLSALNDLTLGSGSVLEIACGSGNNASIIKKALDKSVSFTGTDISRIAVADFEKQHGIGTAFVSDFTKSLSLSSKYDAILILGGVHHMINGLDQLFQNIRNVLLPGGVLIFVEPNQLFLNKIRKFWYKKDKFFDAEDEEAINHSRLFAEFGMGFTLLTLNYIGGPGFFLISQSMILRTPRFI